MENWTSIVKGRSNTCAVVGNIIFRWNAHTFKGTLQKKKLPMNFFETFPECSPPGIVSKKNDTSPFSLKTYDGPILPHLCLFPCKSRALFIGSR